MRKGARVSELDEEYLTPAECGTKLNLQVATVRRLIRDGVLLPNKLGRGWQIPANVLDAFITGGLQLDVSHKQAQNQRRRKNPQMKDATPLLSARYGMRKNLYT